MKKLKLRRDKWKDWLAFEGVSEEALYLIRVHVATALKRKEKGRYDFKKINLNIQKA
jgi:hypothetical protein